MFDDLNNEQLNSFYDNCWPNNRKAFAAVLKIVTDRGDKKVNATPYALMNYIRNAISEEIYRRNEPTLLRKTVTLNATEIETIIKGWFDCVKNEGMASERDYELALKLLKRFPEIDANLLSTLQKEVKDNLDHKKADRDFKEWQDLVKEAFMAIRKELQP